MLPVRNRDGVTIIGTYTDKACFLPNKNPSHGADLSPTLKDSLQVLWLQKYVNSGETYTDL